MSEGGTKAGGPSQPERGKKWWLLWVPVDLYAALLVTYLLLRVVTAGRFWPVEVLSVYIHWLLLLAILLLPVAFFGRRRPTLILLSISGIAFLWLFGSLVVPRSSDRGACEGAGRSASLTAMTYNLSNGLASPESLIQVIAGSGAEVVGIQELPADQAPILQEGLRAAYPYQALYGTGIPGIGLLSRYPIVEEELLELEGVHPYLRAKLEIEGRPLTVLVAHPPVAFGPPSYGLGPEAPSHRDMLVLADMAVEGRPAILMGDFNFTDQNETYQILTAAGLQDAFRTAGRGLGLTHPVKRVSGTPHTPLTRIDLVLVTEDICPERAWVGPDGSSDHLPVLASLRW